ncbi:acyloxyacyl hydrolase [Spirosoma luteolum]
MKSCLRWLLCLCPLLANGQADTLIQRGRLFSVTPLLGLSAPDQVVPATGKVPLGAEFTYSWSTTSRRAWEQGHSFANVGIYANYIAFRNPAVLGRTGGAGLYFEPLIAPAHRVYYAVRLSAGLTYLTRVYDPVTNPTNQYVSLPVSSEIGAAFSVFYRLTDRVQLTARGVYNHISNAGTRQPNQGINIPTVGLGVAYAPRPLRYPDTRTWRTPAPAHRWMARALLLGSVRVLPQTTTTPEMALPMLGLNLVGGYRLSNSHVLSGGIEVTDDRYFKEQIKRWGYTDQRYVQGSILGGYEFWLGRYAFTAHMAWNVVRPQPYKPASYQKYGLLYRTDRGLTLGFHVKAYGESTKGFQAAAGWTF